MSGLRGWLVVLFLTALAVWHTPVPAQAHKVRLFAQVEDGVIRGYGYFSKSSRAQNRPLIVYGPGGEELGRTQTDAQGEFSFKPRVRCDHRLVLDAGEGHQGEFTVRAAELPQDLEPQGQGASGPGQEKVGPAPEEKKDPDPRADPGELDRVVSAALARELEPLKKQLAALRLQLNDYEDKVRWHDVLGGIGFIVGLAGAALLGLGRRSKRGG